MSTETKNPYTCDDCDGTFASNYNLQRHIDRIHGDYLSDIDNEDVGSTISQQSENDKSDTMSISSTSADENLSDSKTELSDTSSDKEVSDTDSSDTASNSDSSGEEYENNVLEDFVTTVLSEYNELFSDLIENYQDNLTQKDATAKAVATLQPTFEKALKRKIVKYITNITRLKRTPLFRSIFDKIKHFKDDGLDEEEAIKSAVSYRKHSIYNLLQTYIDNLLSKKETEDDVKMME